VNEEELRLVGELPALADLDALLASPEGRLWTAQTLHDRLSDLEDGDRIAVALDVFPNPSGSLGGVITGTRPDVEVLKIDGNPSGTRRR
jgi:hypothetical protein